VGPPCGGALAQYERRDELHAVCAAESSAAGLTTNSAAAARISSRGCRTREESILSVLGRDDRTNAAATCNRLVGGNEAGYDAVDPTADPVPCQNLRAGGRI
jgi:hypothetical protein